MKKAFPSPNSDLPPAGLAEQKACIAAVNELLQTLGNPPDPENREALRLRFRSLRGTAVRLGVQCEKTTTLTGTLFDAGRDYLQLDLVGRQAFIPYARICTLDRTDHGDADDGDHGGSHSSGANHGAGHSLALSGIDPQLRRDLILRFGEVVSRRPDLINLFFGLPFHVRLAQLIGHDVAVQTDNSEQEGKLCLVDPGYIQLRHDSSLRQINLADICSLQA